MSRSNAHPLKVLLQRLLSVVAQLEPSDRKPNPQDADRLLELWRRTVETQMHFNEMSVRSRQLGLSFVVAALGVSVVLLSKFDEFQVPLPFGSYSVHPSGLIVAVTAIGAYAVMRLDLGVYHKMLRGAVTFGEQLEAVLIQRQIIPVDKGMTQRISEASREAGSGSPTTAEAKIRKFYHILIAFLVVLGIVLLLITAQPSTSTAGTNPEADVEASE